MPVWYVALVIFAALVGEIYALYVNEGTWTEYTKRFFGIKGRPLKWHAPKAVILAFLIWLMGHMLGWWR